MSAPAWEIIFGFVRLHILHHAAGQPLTGAWMLKELREHGYRISPGTLYPMMRAMEESGYLASKNVQNGRRRFREYRITAKGRTALNVARQKLEELYREVIVESRSSGI